MPSRRRLSTCPSPSSRRRRAASSTLRTRSRPEFDRDLLVSFNHGACPWGRRRAPPTTISFNTITLLRPPASRTPSRLMLEAGTGRRSSSPAAYCPRAPSLQTPPPAASARPRWSDELRQYVFLQLYHHAAPYLYNPRPVSGTSPRAWPARPRRAGPTVEYDVQTDRLFFAPASGSSRSRYRTCRGPAWKINP